MEPYPVGDQGRAPLTRRTLLRAWVKIGLLVCAAAFVGVFVYGMFSPGMRASGKLIDVGGVPVGSARLEAWNGKPVWVVHRSDEQLDVLAGLSEYVAAPDKDGHPGGYEPVRDPGAVCA